MLLSATNDIPTPDYMEIPKLKFILKLPKANLNKHDIAKQLMKIVEDNNMSSYLLSICTEFNWKLNESLLEKMISENKNNLMELDKLCDHDDIQSIWKDKLELLMKTGEWNDAYKFALEKISDSKLSTNNRLDAIFTLFRISYLRDCDIKAMHNAIEKARAFISSTEHKIDWSGQNKMKAYEGFYALSVRDYKRAALNLHDCISTFESNELTTFSTIVKYTVIACMIILPRCELKKKIVNNGVIMQELNCQQNSKYKEFVHSLNNCHYADFFRVLVFIEEDLRRDPITNPHYRQYMRNMRLIAYNQLLQSYSTVNLKRMAEIFGVSQGFVESEVSHFIGNGNLICNIDKVIGQIITAQGGESVKRSILYQAIIKKGDILLNNIKKLSRIVDNSIK